MNKRINKRINKNIKSSYYQYEHWQAKQLREMPDCYTGSGAEGKELFQSILETCAREYPEDIETFAERFNSEKCFPSFSPREVRSCVLNALRIARVPSSSICLSEGGRQTRKIQYDPEAVQRFIEDIPVDVDEMFLCKRSPMPLDRLNATLFLNALYKPGEKIFVTDNFEQKEPSAIVTIGDEMPNSTLERLARENQNGVWYYPNPVSGKWVKTNSNDSHSMRCKAALTAFPFLFIESDKVSESDWLKIVCSLELPVAAIYKSGRRSIHVMIKIDAKSIEDWEAKVAPLKAMLIPLGADPAVMRLSQLSRLPQCLRGNTGRMQKLLYLDPEPDGVPIIEKPYISYGVSIRNKIKNYSHFLCKGRLNVPENNNNWTEGSKPNMGTESVKREKLWKKII